LSAVPVQSKQICICKYTRLTRGYGKKYVDQWNVGGSGGAPIPKIGGGGSKLSAAAAARRDWRRALIDRREINIRTLIR